MKTRSPLAFVVTMFLVAALAAFAWGTRFRQTQALRTELTLTQLTAEELTRLKAEHERLKARQISAAELEALRADHAVVARLRAEVEALQRAVPGK